MSELLITARTAVLRDPRGLVEEHVALRLSSDAHEFDERRVPLDVDAAASSGHARLAKAWRTLASVAEPSPDVAGAVAAVLARTVCDATARGGALPSIDVAEPPPVHRATAANPRAYKGTKDRPPKPRRAEPLDLRPFLASAKGLRALLGAGMARAEDVDLELDALLREQPAALASAFGTWLLAADGDARRALVQRFHELGLERHEDLRRGLALVFALAPERALAWTELVALTPESRRDAFVLALLETRAHELDPAPFVCVARDLPDTAGASYGTHIHYALARLRAGDPNLCHAAFVSETLELVGSRRSPKDSDPLPDERACALLRSLVERGTKEIDTSGLYVLKRAASDPLVASYLEQLVTRDLGSEHLLEWSLAVCLRAGRPLGRLDHRATLRDFEACLTAFAETATTHRTKAIQIVREFLEVGDERALDLAAAFVRVVCAPPFEAGGEVHRALEVFGQLEPEARRRVAIAPRESFRALDRATRRGNEAWIVAGGLDRLRHEDSELLVDAFVRFPGELIGCARRLGLLSSPHGRRLVAEVAVSELPATEAAATLLAASDLVEIVDRVGGDAGRRHVSRRMRRHVTGEATLGPMQLERDLVKLLDAWPAVRCSAICERVEAELRRGLVGTYTADVEALTDAMSHALAMQSVDEQNRRGLRRLIRACSDGDTEYVLRHPDNAAWLRRHPRIDAATWCNGVTTRGEVPGFGVVMLVTETDPLEALRLGTYAGTCLGVGGSFSYSAAAIVLDVNKQVVFARDSRGVFVARQVLAIDEEDHLVPFNVYPQSRAEVRALFSEHARSYARALGIELALFEVESDGNTERREIALTASHRWWDDGPWDLELEPDSEGR